MGPATHRVPTDGMRVVFEVCESVKCALVPGDQLKTVGSRVLYKPDGSTGWRGVGSIRDGCADGRLELRESGNGRVLSAELTESKKATTSRAPQSKIARAVVRDRNAKKKPKTAALAKAEKHLTTNNHTIDRWIANAASK